MLACKKTSEMLMTKSTCSPSAACKWCFDVQSTDTMLPINHRSLFGPDFTGTSCRLFFKGLHTLSVVPINLCLMIVNAVIHWTAYKRGGCWNYCWHAHYARILVTSPSQHGSYFACLLYPLPMWTFLSHVSNNIWYQRRQAPGWSLRKPSYQARFYGRAEGGTHFQYN